MKIAVEEDAPVYALLYLRVSTDRQAEEGYSIDIQKERLTAYVKSMFGSQNVKTELFIDDGYSGGSLDRPAMQRLIEVVRSGAASHVIVYKLDRLSRSQKDTLYLIEDVFLPHNTAFVSMQESFNTATPFGRAVVGILSVFAQFERENIFERTRGGMQKRVESGLWMGGGRVPFGYDYDREKGILVPNQDAELVRRVYELYLKGYSLQRIANMLGLKYDKLAYQILTRKSNTGVIVYNGVEYQGKHEPIVSLETYEQAMAMLRDRATKKYSTTTHLLTGLVYCGVCGAKMRYIKWGKAGYKLMCYSKEKSKQYLVRDPNCDNESVWADEIEATVIEDLFRMTNVTAEETSEQETVEAADILPERVDTLAKKLKRLYDLYAEDGNEILLSSIHDIQEEMGKVKEELALEEERGFWSKSIQRAKDNIRDIQSAWEYMTTQEKRIALQSVVERITVTHESVNISYKF
jgi:site-specific DNA recombinase